MSKSQKKRILTLIVIFIIGVISLIVEKADRSDVSTTNDNQDNSQYGYVHYIDVGQGDCTLIETYDGKFGLIDASTQNACFKILSYLEDEGVEELEFVLFTHPHEDHIGCGDEVVDSFKVKTVYMTDKTENTAAYRRLINSVSKSKEDFGTQVIMPLEGDIFHLGDIEFTVLSDGRAYEDLNDSSICLKMELGKSTFIFTGDAGKQVEDRILKCGVNISAEVLKLGHHGSSTSNSDSFLDAVNPDIAVTSCALDNDYGHPHREIISAMIERNVVHKRTDLDGDIILAFDEDSISIL